VVVEGNFKIDSALQIQAKPSMMSPPPKKPPSKPEVKEEFEEPPSKPKAKEEPGRPSVSYKALSAAIQSYLHIQHALAADDFVKAQVSFMELRKGLISMAWMKEKASLMKATKVAIDAEDITSMRAAFAGLSEVFLRTLRQLGHRWKRPLYEFHCPMALNGAGASWVQDNEETSNPYFGASMLRCGVKKTTFTPKP
jgi:Cu(I)/Ag(I) efflux system membrane fusion protein